MLQLQFLPKSPCPFENMATFGASVSAGCMDTVKMPMLSTEELPALQNSTTGFGQICYLHNTEPNLIFQSATSPRCIGVMGSAQFQSYCAVV